MVSHITSLSTLGLWILGRLLDVMLCTSLLPRLWLRGCLLVYLMLLVAPKLSL
ncbi:hypothetical protein LINPERPRIM_LOCUS22073 [Linum perenne]